VNQERKTFARRSFLVVVFLGCFVLWAVSLRWLAAAGITLEKAPLIRSLLLFGVGPIVAWTGANGLNNLLVRQPFLSEMHWREVAVLAFCFALYGVLSDELEALFPGYRDRSTDDPSLLEVGVLLLCGLIGWGLWPRKKKQGQGRDDHHEESEDA
jgi:hypothetical protein